jgi:hypothetical protein
MCVTENTTYARCVSFLREEDPLLSIEAFCFPLRRILEEINNFGSRSQQQSAFEAPQANANLNATELNSRNQYGVCSWKSIGHTSQKVWLPGKHGHLFCE